MSKLNANAGAANSGAAQRDAVSGQDNPIIPQTEKITTAELNRWPGWSVFTAAEALSDPLPPVDWVVQNLIAAGSVVVWAGHPGSGKTYAALDLAVSVASGGQWLHLATESGRVLILDAESGRRRITARLGEVIRGHDAAAYADRVTVACVPGMDLATEEDAAKLFDLIIATGARLVVVDALVDVMRGDENAAGDVQPVMQPLRNIAQATGAAVVVIHHHNKNGTYRGSSAIKGAANCLLSITKQGHAVTFTVEKNQDAEPLEIRAQANWDAGKFWLAPVGPAVTVRNDLPDDQRAALEVVRDNTGITNAEAAERLAIQLSIGPRQARNVIQGLIYQGRLRKAGKAGRSYILELTASGRLALGEGGHDDQNR